MTYQTWRWNRRQGSSSEPPKNEFYYVWDEKYEAWLATRAMDGARDKENTRLVIVPKDNAFIAVNIQREGWTNVAECRDAVKQGTQAFLTYDANFASRGRHKWWSNKNWRVDGSPQWEDRDWMVLTSVEALLPEKRLQIEGPFGELGLEAGHNDKKSKTMPQ